MEPKSVVWHIIPSMKHGGVEVGIVKSYSELNRELDYRVVSLFSLNEINNLKVYSLSEFLASSNRTDKVIVSLWKSYLFGWFLKLRGYRVVPFVHHSGNVHILANIITKITTKVFKKGLADSSASANYYRVNYQIAPYIFDYGGVHSLERPIDVIWVGRDAAQKRFDLAMRVMEILADMGYNVLSIIASQQQYQFEHPVEYNLSPHTVLHELSKSKVYLQLSSYEGFSMSTAEAIVSGCRPYVTPVGEIKSYLEDEYYVRDLEPDNIIREIKKILAEPDLGRNERIERLSSYGSYTESVKQMLNEA